MPIVQIVLKDVASNPLSLLEVDVRHENTDKPPELPSNFLRCAFRISFIIHGLIPAIVTGAQVCSSSLSRRTYADGGWEHQTDAGMTVRADGTEFEPMTKIEREQLTHLIELRDMIRKKLIEHGQIEA